MSKKFGRNDPCPCGEDRKYKNCCEGKIPWPQIVAAGPSECVRHLSARGKNLLFLKDIAGALQIDELKRLGPDWGRLKRAFTPAAVKKIFESVMELWPDGEDLERVLRQERPHTTGLYVGTYDPEAVCKGVSRHSLYSDTILLIDPFSYAANIRPEMNPLAHPEKYRTTALKCATIWFEMLPWIRAGIVKFVRVPSDFNLHLLHESMRIQKSRRAKYPELEEIAERTAKERVEEMKEMQEWYMLLHPDETIRDDCKKPPLNLSDKETEEFVKHIHRRREAHPFYLEPLEVQGRKVGELVMESSGAAYDMAKRTALLSGSYLITDLEYRWREIEIDRQEARIDAHKWSPFAKAFQEAEIKYLDNLPLEAALRLREQGRLEDMRGFLRKVWKNAATPDSFENVNALNLAAELQEKVREAGDEWAKIDRDLLKWFGTLGPATATIVNGAAGWVPAAISAAVAGVTGVAVSQHQKNAFEQRYPAGFFLKLKKQTGK